MVAPGRQAARRAAAFLRALVPDARMLVWTPGPGFEDRLVERALDLDIRGSRVFHLQIAFTALEHGANEIWTHDAGFVRVAGITVRDPIA